MKQHETNGPLPPIPTGALVGPPWSKRENGYVLTENVPQGISLYYEPHCDYDAASVASVGPVDVVVSPPCNQELLGYPLVKGNTDSVKLVSMLQPAALIALCNAEFDASGPLDALIAETVWNDPAAYSMFVCFVTRPCCTTYMVCLYEGLRNSVASL